MTNDSLDQIKEWVDSIASSIIETQEGLSALQDETEQTLKIAGDNCLSLEKILARIRNQEEGKPMTEMTDDEVLELAEKIKRKRESNKIYEHLSEQMLRLQSLLIHDNSLEAHFKVKTITDSGEINRIAVHLPNEMTEGLMMFIQAYIEGREIK